jgi:hypothetical protein
MGELSLVDHRYVTPLSLTLMATRLNHLQILNLGLCHINDHHIEVGTSTSDIPSLTRMSAAHGID